jgi:hypothetical protein
MVDPVEGFQALLRAFLALWGDILEVVRLVRVLAGG